MHGPRARRCSAPNPEPGTLNPELRTRQVPLFDAFVTRMTSSDAPSDGLSHFAKDMQEASSVARLYTRPLFAPPSPPLPGPAPPASLRLH